MNGATSLRPISATALAGWIFLALVGLALAVFFGLIASTANPILVGIGLALLVVGVLPIWVEGLAARAVWGVAALASMLYTLLNTLWQPSTGYHALSGFKRYIQVAGILFALSGFTWHAAQHQT